MNVTPTTWLADQLRLPRCETVPHGIDPPIASPIRTQTGKSAPVAVSIGRLVTTKGLRTLLKALRMLKTEEYPCELLVIGEGPDREALEGHTQRSGLSDQVHFLGRVPEAQIPATLSRADVIVAPSIGGEVFGMVVLENMHRGLPILASDLGCFREVLGNGGLTFRTTDPDDLAKQLAAILNDPALARKRADIARERARNLFTEKVMIEGHARIYRRCVEAH